MPRNGDSVPSAPIVIEERLRTQAITAVLSLVVVVYAVVFVTLHHVGRRGHVSTWGWGVGGAAFALLFAAALLSTVVVARVVEAPDGRALEILYGPWGLARQVFAAGEIESATARRLELGQIGGWGYRGSLRFLKRAAVVTRRGAALEVHLTGGRVFVVTVDEPADFATALRP